VEVITAIASCKNYDTVSFKNYDKLGQFRSMWSESFPAAGAVFQRP